MKGSFKFFYHDNNLDELVDVLADLTGEFNVVIKPVDSAQGLVTKPLDRAQLLSRAKGKKKTITSVIAVPYSLFIETQGLYEGSEYFLDTISKKITGHEGGLTDIYHKPVGVEGSNILLEVTASVKEYLEEFEGVSVAN